MYTFPFVPFRYSKTLSIGILILVLCLIPSSKFSGLDVSVTFADVIVHFLMFCAFSAALYFDITKKRVKQFNRSTAALITIGISFGMGALTEFLQYLITSLNRTGSLTDLLFDLLGSIAGVTFISVIRRYLNEPEKVKDL